MAPYAHPSEKPARHVFYRLVLLLTLIGIGAPTLLANQPADAPQIMLQSGSFDPLRQPSAAQVQAETGPTLYLVQFYGPVEEAWKQAVAATGARLYGYIPEYAFIARMDAATASAVGRLPEVRWVGPYLAEYRIEPGLAGAALAGVAEERMVVQTLPDADYAALAAQVNALGGTVEGEARNEIAGYLTVRLPAAQTAALSAHPEVVWIGPATPVQRMNTDSEVKIIRADGVRQQLGLYGAGQVVAVADSGLDVGDPARLHPDLRGRLIRAYCLGRPQPCDWSDPDGHGTHVAGSVLGSGATSGANPATHSYGGSFAGVAPEARLVFQSTGDANGGLGGIPNDLGDLMRQAYADGARIHTNSWGGPTGQANGRPTYGGYTPFSQQADLAAWQHPDLLILFAAGNEGEDANGDGVVDADSMASPATAKNVLTVGASENNRPGITSPYEDSYGAPIGGSRRADNPSGMAAFSSRGPTDDGRIKPDIVAPGTFVVSTRTQRFALNDTFEGDTSSYVTTLSTNGGTTSWQLAGPAHSGARAWVQSARGTFQPGALSLLVTPPLDLTPIGGVSLQWFQRYQLGGDDKLILAILGPSIQNPQELASLFLELPLQGSQNSFALHSFDFPVSALVERNINPTTARIGFAVASDDSQYASEWAIDNLRVGGMSWGLLSDHGLTAAGSAQDDAYVTMGGTSMATPLTAGAAAIGREWLATQRQMANPSGALLKALLINGAASMGAGQYGTGATREIPAGQPNNVSGWGRLDLLASLNPPAPQAIWLHDQPTGLATGETQTFQVIVGAGGTVQGIMPTEATPTAFAQNDSQMGRIAQMPEHGETLAPSISAAEAAPATLGRLNTLELPRGPFTAQPAQVGGTQLLANPGFEQGLTGWLTNGTPAAVADVRRSGTSAVRLGGRDDAYDSLGQRITIPAGATAVSLSGYVAVATEETYPESDFFCAGIWLADTLVAGNCTDVTTLQPGSWLPFTITLTPQQIATVAGQQVTPAVLGETDISLVSTFYLDDLSFTVSAPTTPTPCTGGPACPTTPTPCTGGPACPTTPTPCTGGPACPPAPPLRITLAWTDYPGQPGAGRTLVNDLDLEIVGPNGTRYLGNSGAYPTGHNCLSDGRDRCNNVEGVFIPNAAPGVYTVTVRAQQVAQGGRQPFALVGAGHSLRLNGQQPPTVTPRPGTTYRAYLPLVER